MEITQDILDGFVLDTLDDEKRQTMKDQMKSDQGLSEDLALHGFVIKGVESVGLSSFQSMVKSVEENLDQEGFFSDEFEQEIVKGIESTGHQDFQNMLDEVESSLDSESFFENGKPETKVVSMPFNRVMAVAASILALIAAGFWLWPETVSNDELYDIHFATLPDQISDAVDAELGEIGFSDSDPQSLVTLKKALTLYSSEDYESFLSKSESMLDIEELSHYKMEVLLYQSIALMELGRYEEALVKLNASKGFEDSNWYAALCYLQLELEEEAVKLLESEELQRSEYAEDAEVIVKAINR